MPTVSQPYDLKALVPKLGLSDYWLISVVHQNVEEVSSHEILNILSQSKNIIFCLEAKSLINKYNIKPTPTLRLACLSTIKKLIHKNNLEAELEIPDFNNSGEASGWAQQAVMSALDKIHERHMHDLIALECQVIPAMIAMEKAGLYFNKARWQKTLNIFEQEREELKEKLKPHFQKTDGFMLFGPETIDLQNPQEVKSRLEALLGLKLKSTSQSSLKNFDHEAVKLLLKYREHSRMISTYGESFLNNITDDRIYASFVPLGSPSGRFACHEPNLQALPNNPSFQACLKPDKRALLYFDYGAFELRILAALSQDPALLDIFNAGLDIHSMVAQAVFKTSVSKKENTQLREQAKILNFGLIYGMGERALADKLNTSLNNAQDLMNNYFARFPKVLQLLQSLESKAKNLNFVNTALGRRVYFSGDESPGVRARLARNIPIQGTGADIAKLALCKVFKSLYESKLDAQLVNMIHDELVIECDKESRAQVEKLVSKAMNDAFLAILPAIKPEISIS